MPLNDASTIEPVANRHASLVLKVASKAEFKNLMTANHCNEIIPWLQSRDAKLDYPLELAYPAGAEVLAEYTGAYGRVADLALRIPKDEWRVVSIIPWYGPEYSLADLVAYIVYGHKHDHCAQIAVFIDSLTQLPIPKFGAN